MGDCLFLLNSLCSVGKPSMHTFQLKKKSKWPFQGRIQNALYRSSLQENKRKKSTNLRAIVAGIMWLREKKPVVDNSYLSFEMFIPSLVVTSSSQIFMQS